MKYILLLLSIMVCSCGPQEPFEEQRETTKVDSSYYFRNMAELELETQQVVEESIACDYGKQFICPNCASLLMDMSVKIVNTQKKDEKIQAYT